jgi:hypothetical protein
VFYSRVFDATAGHEAIHVLPAWGHTLLVRVATTFSTPCVLLVVGWW